MRTVEPSGVAGSRAPDRRPQRRSDRRSGHVAGRDLAAVVDVTDGWEAAARCRGEDPALFFGPNRFEPKQERLAREAEAKAVCATCPAIVACREHALATGELYGVWGGLGEADRRSLLAGRGGVARAV